MSNNKERHIHICDLNPINVSIQHGETITFTFNSSFPENVPIRISVDKFPPGTKLDDFTLNHPNCKTTDCLTCHNTMCGIHQGSEE